MALLPATIEYVEGLPCCPPVISSAISSMDVAALLHNIVVKVKPPVLFTGYLKYWLLFFIIIKPLSTGVLAQVVAVPVIVASPVLVLIVITPSERLVDPVLKVWVCKGVPHAEAENISSFNCSLEGTAPLT